jgi:hypothetical protein
MSLSLVVSRIAQSSSCFIPAAVRGSSLLRLLSPRPSSDSVTWHSECFSTAQRPFCSTRAFALSIQHRSVLTCAPYLRCDWSKCMHSSLFNRSSFLSSCQTRGIRTDASEVKRSSLRDFLESANLELICACILIPLSCTYTFMPLLSSDVCYSFFFHFISLIHILVTSTPAPTKEI